jgi:hypothetical protein
VKETFFFSENSKESQEDFGYPNITALEFDFQKNSRIPKYPLKN